MSFCSRLKFVIRNSRAIESWEKMLVKDINAVFIVVMFLIFTSQVHTFSPLDSTNFSNSYELKSLPSAKLPSLLAAVASGIMESVIDRIMNGMVATVENQTPGRTCECSMC